LKYFIIVPVGFEVLDFISDLWFASSYHIMEVMHIMQKGQGQTLGWMVSNPVIRKLAKVLLAQKWHSSFHISCTQKKERSFVHPVCMRMFFAIQCYIWRCVFYRCWVESSKFRCVRTVPEKMLMMKTSAEVCTIPILLS